MRVLAFVAHPDDIELQCGGTLIKCVQRGDDVYACHLSNGDLGHVVIMPKELGIMRRNEAQDSGKVGGYHVLYGGFTDLEIFSGNRKSRDVIVDIIREIKPDFIITHNPVDYMADHVATSKLVLDASYAATLPDYPSKTKEPAKECPIYFMSPSRAFDFTPNEYVDVTDVMDLKKQAFLCHKSQVEWLMAHTHTDPTLNMYNASEFWGRQCGVKYAEVFSQHFSGSRITTKRLLP